MGGAGVEVERPLADPRGGEGEVLETAGVKQELDEGGNWPSACLRSL